jgi:hypothetical protein
VAVALALALVFTDSATSLAGLTSSKIASKKPKTKPKKPVQDEIIYSKLPGGGMTQDDVRQKTIDEALSSPSNGSSHPSAATVPVVEGSFSPSSTPAPKAPQYNDDQVFKQGVTGIVVKAAEKAPPPAAGVMPYTGSVTGVWQYAAAKYAAQAGAAAQYAPQSYYVPSRAYAPAPSRPPGLK